MPILRVRQVGISHKCYQAVEKVLSLSKLKPQLNLRLPDIRYGALQEEGCEARMHPVVQPGPSGPQKAVLRDRSTPRCHTIQSIQTHLVKQECLIGPGQSIRERPTRTRNPVLATWVIRQVYGESSQEFCQMITPFQRQGCL